MAVSLHTRTMRKNRPLIEALIENLVELLDLTEPDPDLEEEPDKEPWLAGGYFGLGGDDRELDQSDDERELGWTEQEAMTGLYGPEGYNNEPSLGAPNAQAGSWNGVQGAPDDDREEDCEDEGAQCEDEGAQCDDEGARDNEDFGYSRSNTISVEDYQERLRAAQKLWETPREGDAIPEINVRPSAPV